MTILLTHLKGKTQMEDKYTKIAISLGDNLSKSKNAIFKIGVLTSAFEIMKALKKLLVLLMQK